MKKIITVTLLAVMTLMLLAPAAQAATTRFVYTENGKSLNVRSTPAVADNIIGRLKYGEAVVVLEAYANGWSSISWQNDFGEFVGAYVQSRYLVAQLPATKPNAATVSDTDAASDFKAMNAQFKTAKSVTFYYVYARPTRATGWVNLRWAPSADAELIIKCEQGRKLMVLVEMKDWYQVQDTETGMIGFISRKYVSR